ncbi:hypothetical protein DFQ28_003654 [Apophysomyces sp. BC1034]|nr:hypothetical protein DFQ29_001363 [Apophysomyces sp. BC1021]KAG0193734.1 hypothetical protein DFQ28_003654 [Apophysomyces sp. BC1034]
MNKLLNQDILEKAARVLEHFAATRTNKLESAALQPPQHLIDQLLQKCDNFDTACDQIYYTLEQSKRVLQLEWQQKMALQSQADKMEQEKQDDHDKQQEKSSEMDTDVLPYFSPGMDSSTNMQQDSHTEQLLEDEDMDELLQIQRERLERVRKVIVLGMDAESVKATQNGGEEKDDLLF